MTEKKTLTEKDKARIEKFMDMVNNPEQYPQAEAIFGLIDNTDRFPEEADNIFTNLEECFRAMDLIQKITECGPSSVAEGIVTFDAIHKIADRAQHNALCAIQEILLLFPEDKTMERRRYYLSLECHFLTESDNPELKKAA
ncbi:MAG: hypothetical protein C4576_28315 [Desulfobacteraceae bacterium]|nr:MAG: hypothetical protein C4576_28315 [Desulfobacteraceae bacterium]